MQQPCAGRDAGGDKAPQESQCCWGDRGGRGRGGWGLGSGLNFPELQVRKPRLRESKWFEQYHNSAELDPSSWLGNSMLPVNVFHILGAFFIVSTWGRLLIIPLKH